MEECAIVTCKVISNILIQPDIIRLIDKQSKARLLQYYPKSCSIIQVWCC